MAVVIRGNKVVVENNRRPSVLRRGRRKTFYDDVAADIKRAGKLPDH